MTFRHGTTRADGLHAADGTGGSPPTDKTADDESTGDDPTGPESDHVDHGTESDPLSADQRREWRRWIVEDSLSASYSVVPVDQLVETICEREPEAVSRSTVRTALTESVLPHLGRESVLEYDVDRELLINYGD